MNISNSAVNLNWITQSETNLLGYNIYRGESDSFAEALSLNAFIQATNTSQIQSYVFSDSDIQLEQTYWYWLEVMELDGINSYHGPVSITTPGQEPYTPVIPLISGLTSLYPNPFNPCLTVNYALEHDSYVCITVSNIRGQVVRTLLNETKARGNHSYAWDGTDQTGSACASGTYCITMTADKKIYTRKAVLLK